MAQETINIGLVPNDGNGDPNRTAFDKSNNNFTELYTKDGVQDGRLTQNESDIGTNVTDIGTNVTDIGTNTSDIALRRLITDSFSQGEVDQRSLSRIPRNGLSFNGVDDMATVEDSPLFSFVNSAGLDTPFSVIVIVNMKDTTSFPIVAKAVSSSSGEWRAETTSGDQFQFSLRDQSAGVNINMRMDQSFSDFQGKVTHICVTYDGRGGATAADGIIIYVNGEVEASTATNNGSYVAMENLTSPLLIGTLGSQFAEGEIYSCVIYNRELSPDEVLALTVSGARPDFSDQVLADPNNPYFSDFSAGVNGFSGTNLTVAGNIDSIGGLDDNLRGTLTGGSTTHYFQTSGVSMASLVAGKKYRISYSFYIPSSNSLVDGIRLAKGDSGKLDTIQSAIDTWTDYSFELVWEDFVNDFFRVFAYEGANVTLNADGDVLYIRAVTVEEIGSIWVADLEAGVAGQLPDISSNGNHAFIDNAKWSIPKRSGVLRYSTSTSGNQQIIGDNVIPDNARITGWTINSSGTPTIDLGNVSAGTQFDAATVLVSGRNQISLDTEYSSTGELWVNSDDSSVLQHSIYFELVD